MQIRFLATLITIPISFGVAQAQTNSLFISDNVMTGQMWNGPTNAGSGTSGSCSLTPGIVQYYVAPFYTDTTASTYSLHLTYPSSQAGYVYLYQDAFDTQDPCAGLFVFGYAPVATVNNIQLDANRQYFFVTSEDVLFTGGGAFQASIDGPVGSHLFPGTAQIPPVAFCFGDASGTACPCGNSGAAGNGCANSSSANGAKLLANGNASIANDTLVLTGTNMPNSTALCFQGTVRTNGGAGSPFGDGLRCVAGAVVRLGVKTNVAGTSSYPASGDQLISIKGSNSAGDVRYYQCWYRDPTPYCTTSTFNLSNALQVTWAP